MKIYTITLLFAFGVFTSGSCDRKIENTGQTKQKKAISTQLSSISKPVKNDQFTIGEPIPVQISKPDTLLLDSIQVFFRGIPAGTFLNDDEIYLSTSGLYPGKAGVRIRTFFANGSTEGDSRQVELLSDVVPIPYKVRLVNTFSHDVGAYTQGLQYYDGWFYEGTGNYNQSTIRKVRIENGEVIQVRNNASNIFGEGITVFNGKIYQLTYKSQICFVYDLNTFEEIQKYYFQNKEGWGLTNNGQELIMSDGTNIIYYIDPEMFTVKRQIEVYNNEGPVESLNELEYINGKIYANLYYSDEIVIIDPLSGKVEGRIDLKGILSVQDRKPSTNVLNGIAWDEKQNRLFVTGKYWPKLFEIKLLPVQP